MQTLQFQKTGKLLTEATDVLYHITSEKWAAKIVTQKQFSLTLALGNNAEDKYVKKFKVYYLSTARTPSSGYVHSNTYSAWNGSVLFELDGRFINRKNKITPIDYWANHSKKKSPYEYGNKGYSDFEAEDRIQSHDPFLKFPHNPSDMIKSIRMFVSTPDDEEIKKRWEKMGKDEYHERKKNVFKTFMLSFQYYLTVSNFCIKNNIPCYIYTERNAFLQNNKSKAKKLSEIYNEISKFDDRSKIEKNPDYDSPWGYDGSAGIKNNFKRLQATINLYEKQSIIHLTKDDRDMLHEFRYDKDYFALLLNKVSKSKEEIIKKQSKRITDILRTLRIKNPRDFSIWVSKKWEIIEAEEKDATASFKPGMSKTDTIKQATKLKLGDGIGKLMKLKLGDNMKTIDLAKAPQPYYHYPDNGEIDKKIKKMLANLTEESVEVPASGMLYSRSILPQIKDDDAFLTFLKLSGVEYTKKTLKLADIKPTQTDHNLAKVKNLMKSDGLNKPIFISIDNYILDGHHRWLANLNVNGEGKMPVYQVNLPIFDLVQQGKEFINSTAIVETKVSRIRSIIKKSLKNKL